MSGRRPGRSCPVRLVRSAMGMSVQPVERTSSVHASGVQASGAIPGVRTDRPLVSAALPPRCPRRAGPRSGSVWWAAPAGRSGPTCPWSAGGVVACLHRAGREGMVRRWPCLARMRSTVARPPLGRRRAAAPSWPQRADTGVGPGPGRRPGAGEHRAEQVLTGPRRAIWAGRWCGARPWAWTRRW
jgi:hypothetical protein